MEGLWRSGGRALLAMGCCVAALVTTAPAVAYAAENLPPKQPLVKDLRMGGKACGAGDAKAFLAESRPLVNAVVHDADGGRVSAEFEAWWTDAEGAEQRRTLTTTALSSGTPTTFRPPWEEVPANTVVSWHVRADDGTAKSPWSSEGTGSACEFVYDDVHPEKAAVTSPEYPEDVLWVDGVGVYGHFTMDSPSDDVVAYQYSFLRGPHATGRPDEPGGPVTVPYVPLTSGSDRLTVRAVDRAGRSSGETSYRFFVKSGRAPVAHWNLGDPAGSGTAAAETGAAAGVGGGVTFGGPAPSGTGLASTATLDGGGDGYLTPDAPAVADPRKTFAVSAWARPARTDRDMAVVSQDAAGAAGLTLGLTARDEAPVWSFTVGGARVSGGVPETGEWAHLLGVYDAETGGTRLYVNGDPVGTTAEAAPGAVAGDFQIGRALDGASYRDHWQGELGAVKVHDRVVVPGEATGLAHRKPRVLAHWSLENASDGASPEQGGGEPLKLGPGAAIHRGPDGSCLPDLDPDCPAVPYALVGDGHLTLDGETGYAATEGPVVDTADSFSVGVVVRLSDAEPTRPMTVLSQGGEHTDVFRVRYEPSTYAWQLIMPHADEPGAEETVVAQVAMPDGGEGVGHRIAVVYDDADDRIKLYLDGALDSASTAGFADGVPSSGPLQVGRARVRDGWGEHLRGDVDEVHAFAGALGDRDVNQLGWGTEPCLC
ncbi:LamG domain-containing protein [Streptomyces brasiliscabiei]|uniref:LamG domain-containing protein n=1 Tax=Streptomyces brasiliscabiei TaxID=2736302 RepID=UPI001F339CFE|nr:LamG domain-containing protein [Streptomyces brasiliscabiei]